MRTRIITTLVVLAVLFGIFLSLRGCGSGSSGSQNPTIADLQKQIENLQKQIEEAKKAAQTATPVTPATPAPEQPTKSDVERAFDGAVKQGGIMVFGNKNVKDYVARGEAEKKRQEEASVLIAGTMQRELEKSAAGRKKERLQQRLEGLKRQLVVEEQMANWPAPLPLWERNQERAEPKIRAIEARIAETVVELNN